MGMGEEGLKVVFPDMFFQSAKWFFGAILVKPILNHLNIFNDGLKVTRIDGLV
jgi:hypothetical protein